MILLLLLLLLCVEDAGKVSQGHASRLLSIKANAGGRVDDAGHESMRDEVKVVCVYNGNEGQRVIAWSGWMAAIRKVYCDCDKRSLKESGRPYVSMHWLTSPRDGAGDGGRRDSGLGQQQRPPVVARQQCSRRVRGRWLLGHKSVCRPWEFVVCRLAACIQTHPSASRRGVGLGWRWIGHGMAWHGMGGCRCRVAIAELRPSGPLPQAAAGHWPHWLPARFHAAGRPCSRTLLILVCCP